MRVHIVHRLQRYSKFILIREPPYPHPSALKVTTTPVLVQHCLMYIIYHDVRRPT